MQDRTYFFVQICLWHNFCIVLFEKILTNKTNYYEEEFIRSAAGADMLLHSLC